MRLTPADYAEIDIRLANNETYMSIAARIGCCFSTVSARAGKMGLRNTKMGRPKVERRHLEPQSGYLWRLESAKRKLGFTGKTLSEDEKLMVGAIMQRDAGTRKPKPLENMSSYFQGEDGGFTGHQRTRHGGAE